MYNKHYLINSKINLGDKLVHHVSRWVGTVTEIKSKSRYEITFDNGFVSHYCSEDLRSIFIRYDTYVERKQEITVQKVADEIKQMFTKKAN